MELNLKNFRIIKNKNYLKNTHIFLIYSGINSDSKNYRVTQQEFSKLDLNYYNIFNQAARKALLNSTMANLIPTIAGTTFFIEPKVSKKVQIKNYFIKNIQTKPINFTLLAIKLNNKIYSGPQFKRVKSLSYLENNLILSRFLLTNLKKYTLYNINK